MEKEDQNDLVNKSKLFVKLRSISPAT